MIRSYWCAATSCAKRAIGLPHKEGGVRSCASKNYGITDRAVRNRLTLCVSLDVRSQCRACVQTELLSLKPSKTIWFAWRGPHRTVGCRLPDSTRGREVQLWMALEGERKMRARSYPMWCIVSLVWLALGVGVPDVSGQAVVNIHQATLMEPDQKTPEISTHELRQLLAEQSATIFDARPFEEYAVSHIPGAITVPAKPGLPVSLYVSDIVAIGRAVQDNKAASLVLYCNGPWCDKSKRLAEELLAAGYTNVRRY